MIDRRLRACCALAADSCAAASDEAFETAAAAAPFVGDTFDPAAAAEDASGFVPDARLIFSGTSPVARLGLGTGPLDEEEEDIK